MKFDLVVIGGGIIGTGIARDAALRGLKVALFEKDDFGSGTSSRSTRIIHGGLRYLEKLDFDLVHEALQERRRLLKNAPHLVEPLPFLFPVYKDHGHTLPVLWAGIGLYDVMNLRRGMPHHRLLPASHALRLEPSLRHEGLHAGFLYYDAQCEFPERICIENAIDAAAHAARIENHARVVGFLQEAAEVYGVRVRHTHDGREENVEASMVLNATGPWLDEVEHLYDPKAPGRLRRTKGVHLVVPRFNQHALIMETRDAKRVFFAIPWGEYTLLGTTDTDYEGPNEDAAADEDDVQYLLSEIRAQLSIVLKESDILFTTAGLRPLRRQTGRATADITRKHEFVDHELTEGRRGLVTVVGGKITTFRNIAEEAVDLVFHKLGRRCPPSATRNRPLPGGAVHDWPAFARQFRDEAQKAGMAPDLVARWLRVYGFRAKRVLQIIETDALQGERFLPLEPVVKAEVQLAVEEEFCDGLSDFMLRRSMWGLHAGQGYRARDAVATTLAGLLGWTEERRQEEIDVYVSVLGQMRSAALSKRPSAVA
ncbi:MAG: glycerol-3-phosphate dehydrogenase [Euryarchaeota archaeon]|nr:glycerol-3-phosphate dehydrogenase [Euryarchaeota archaeon]